MTAHGYVLDVASDESVHSCFSKVFAKHGRVDVVINNSGVLFPDEHRTPSFKTDPAKVRDGYNASPDVLMVIAAVELVPNQCSRRRADL